MSIELRAPHAYVYTILGCPQCMKVKQLLRKANLSYTDVSIDSFPQCHQEVIDRANGDTTLPQIFFEDLHIGGLQKVYNLLEDERARDAFMGKMALRKVGELPPLPEPTTAVDYRQMSKEQHESAVSWVPDEYSTLIAEMRRSNIIKDNKVGLFKTYRNTFKGADLIEWMISEKAMDRKEALEIGQDLLDRHFGTQTSREMGSSFSPDRYYQLSEDDDSRPLNCGVPSEGPTLSLSQFNETMVAIIQPVLDDILTDNGTTVQYYRLVDNDNYARYLNYAKELHRMDPRIGTPDERMTVLINVYNMMLIHMTHKYGPPQSVWQRRKFMNSTYYQIHEHKYALHSILNGILRSNKKGLGMLWKSFGKQDERLPLILPQCEPLVHFALTTGTRSTVRIRAYNTKTVRQELKQNAIDFLRNDNNMKVDNKKNIIYLSKVFKWYAEDFGGSTDKMVEWVVSLLEDMDEESDKSLSVKKMFYTGEYSVEWLAHDWTFNGKERPKEQRAEEIIQDQPKKGKESCKVLSERKEQGEAVSQRPLQQL